MKKSAVTVMRVAAVAGIMMVMFASCGKMTLEQAASNMSVAVEKVSPKQALISVVTDIPNGINAGKCEVGIAYGKDLDYLEGSFMEAFIERDGEASVSAEVVLRHLDCGEDYSWHLFVRDDRKSYRSETRSFKTMSLPSHAIDLGLSNDMLWADVNIGADKPEGFGEVFAYGEISEKDSFTIDSYSYYLSEPHRPFKIKKYSIPDGEIADTWYEKGKFIGDGKYILDPSDDVASVRWGEGWRIPDVEDYTVLMAETTYATMTVGNTEGGAFTAKSGASVFFPFSWFTVLGWPNKIEVPGQCAYRLSQLRTGGIPDKGAAPSTLSSVLLSISNRASLLSGRRELGVPVRAVYDCSVKPRRYEQLPEAAPVSIVERDLVFASKRIKSSSGGGYEFSGLSEWTKANDFVAVSFSFGSTAELNPGDEIKPSAIGLMYPLSSDSNKSTDRYRGNILLESKTDAGLVLKFDNVIFKVNNDVWNLNGSVECPFEV